MTQWLKHSINAVLLTALFVQCSNSDRDDDKDVNASVDYTIASNVYNDTWKEVHKHIATDLAILDSNRTLDPANNIDSITVFPGGFAYPKTVSIYYDGNTLGDLERRRTGVLEAVLSGPYYTPGTTLTFNLSSYTMNGLSLSGTYTMELDSISGDNLSFFYTRHIEDGRIYDGKAGNTGTNIRYRSIERAVIDTVSAGITNDKFFTTIIECDGMATVGTLFSATNSVDVQFGYSCAFDYGAVTELDVPNIATRTARLPVGTACNNEVVVEINLSYQEIPYSVGSAEVIE